MTAAEILSAVQDNIPQASTLTTATFVRHLLRALKLLSTAENILMTSQALSLADGDKSMDYPDDLKAVDYIVVTDSEGLTSDPLTEMDWWDYLHRMEEYSSDADDDEPSHYIDYGGKIYFWPTCDAAYTGYLYYCRYHPADTDSILFPDEWYGPLESLSTWLVARRFARTRYMNLWGGQTEAQAVAFAISHLHGQAKEESNFVAYNDG